MCAYRISWRVVYYYNEFRTNSTINADYMLEYIRISKVILKITELLRIREILEYID